MATMDRISDLFDEFYGAACSELDSCYELLDLTNDCGNWIVVVPNKTASKRLHHWFDRNRRPGDRLEQIKAVAALDLMLENGDWCWDSVHGCQFFEY